MNQKIYDAIVIGGGFYGCNIALHLKNKYQLNDVLLIEKEPVLLSRASYNNQARVHNGYHYPRSLVTAYRSQVNFSKFVNEYRDAIESDFIKIYCIARQNSKITAYQFERFCREINADYKLASKKIVTFFSERLIEQVFLVKEFAFNAEIIRNKLHQRLLEKKIQILLDAEVIEVVSLKNDLLSIKVKSVSEEKTFQAKLLFNCAYSGLANITGDDFKINAMLKHEITEMALVEVPDELANFGITVMDGPFFSLMPFPAKKLHTLSHVRYTPHLNWAQNDATPDPYAVLEEYSKISRFSHMIHDAQRYLPILKDTKYRESLFEIKTILTQNEANDGRPILLEKYKNMPSAFAILGGKIDNIYDIIQALKIDS